MSICEVSFAVYHALAPSDDAVVTIVDNGLTEIAPGTATARVYLD